MIKKIGQFLVQTSKFLVGLGLFLLVGVFILFLQIIFWALSVPCSACLDLSAWLSQTLSLLAPALASLISGLFLRRKKTVG